MPARRLVPYVIEPVADRYGPADMHYVAHWLNGRLLGFYPPCYGSTREDVRARMTREHPDHCEQLPLLEETQMSTKQSTGSGGEQR